MKTFCFKLYRAQRNEKLNRQINAAGLIWNHCLALHKRYYQLFGKYLQKSVLQKHLTKLKRLKKFAYLKEIGSQAVQDVTDRIDRAYRLFFNNVQRKVKCSPPKFKRVRKYKSFTLKQAGWKIESWHNTIIINNQAYRYFKSREIVGKVKTVTVKRDSTGDIFIFVVTDYEENEVIARTGKSVGYDFGFKEKILIASDGKDILAPSFLRSNMKALKRASKSLSKKKFDSKKRERARLELARIYRRTDNQRKDFHWKLAQRLCSEYALICVEDLSLKGLQRNHGRKMQDYGFGMFLQILKYVAKLMGTTIIEVDRFFASSQLCSECGEKNPETKDLNVREWRCPKCGAYHDRDTNAAKNILNEGTRIFLSA
ncbi:MAG: transposase [Selenomonadaceae bacterium]|nr:transposase [Selenomonadaceae bacterium]